MKTFITLEWFKQRFFTDDQNPGVDPPAAAVDWKYITPDVYLATGLISNKKTRITPKEYEKAFAESGVQEMLYYRPDNKPIFGGEQVYVKRNNGYQSITGLFLKKL